MRTKLACTDSYNPQNLTSARNRMLIVGSWDGPLDVISYITIQSLTALRVS